jgi:hypothetical protein
MEAGSCHSGEQGGEDDGGFHDCWRSWVGGSGWIYGSGSVSIQASVVFDGSLRTWRAG